jgi:N-acetyltransferase 10
LESELKDLKENLADTKPVGELIKLAKTLDQAQAILTFVDAISEKTLSSTVTLTAARGRGKSAALGLAIAAALAHGYSNIFVTSPSPENLKTLFDFIFKGMDALGYEEHLDYDIVQSTNPDFNKAIVRVNIFRQHRQTIQVSSYLISYCTVTDSLSSTSNPKMHTYWVRQNSSSLMKQQLYLCLWSRIS